MENEFVLYEMLRKFEPDAIEGDTSVYAAVRNTAIKTDDLTHFAMGIFWKAAVHSWRGGETEPIINLGPYTESVRKFLRGEDGFPRRWR
jgi:hypothetical protein